MLHITHHCAIIAIPYRILELSTKTWLLHLHWRGSSRLVARARVHHGRAEQRAVRLFEASHRLEQQRPRRATEPAQEGADGAQPRARIGARCLLLLLVPVIPVRLLVVLVRIRGGRGGRGGRWRQRCRAVAGAGAPVEERCDTRRERARDTCAPSPVPEAPELLSLNELASAEAKPPNDNIRVVG